MAFISMTEAATGALGRETSFPGDHKKERDKSVEILLELGMMIVSKCRGERS